MLHIHRAERADGLVQALGELLADPLPDPFTSEVVAVPTRGMERWLIQRLSSSLGVSPGRFDGVCANVEFPSPRRLVGGAVAAVSGVDPDEDPWLPGRALWPLLEVVDSSLDEPWLDGLSAYLGGSEAAADSTRRARRLSTVRHLAELFGRYALDRPDMVQAWAAGKTDAGWQAELWQRVRERIALPSPAERLKPACERLRDEPDTLGLPQRLSLFGLTRLPAGDLEVLRSLAAGRDVHLFLLHPSPALWEEVAGRPPVLHRSEDPTADLPANRLLASWGKDSREMQLVMAAGGEHADHHHPV
ncbi:MAG: exodeoxyribonuclease V subunit gamma, partial [Gammaproteobacteria bacterium]